MCVCVRVCACVCVCVCMLDNHMYFRCALIHVYIIDQAVHIHVHNNYVDRCIRIS